MLQIVFTGKFRKDLKRVAKQGRDLVKLEHAIEALARGERLPERMRDHALVGDYRGHRECHIEPDWLLIYIVENSELRLTAVRTGSHGDLLGI